MVDRKKRPSESRLRAGRYALDDEETTEFSVTPRSRSSKRESAIRPPESAKRPTPAAKPARRAAARQAAKGDDVLPGGFLLGNRYEILDLVHSGSMSHVYRARDDRLPADDRGNVNVAVKVLRRRLMDRPDTRNILELEGAKARQLSHPNIINVYDFDEYDGHFCLITEWLDGESVKALLSRTQGKRLDTQFAWHIVDGTARALHHAHSLGFVHADVNPANIFICDTQEIKLLDFGVSRRADDADGDTRRSVWATHPYASPDILDGRPPAVADDIFSIACVAYRLLAGAHPFDDLPPDEARKLGHKPTPIPGLAPADWKLIRSGLSFDSADRPASIAAFERDVAPRTSAPGDPRSPQSGERKGPAPMAWTAAAAAVLVVAALAFSFWPDPNAGVSGTTATDAVTAPGAGAPPADGVDAGIAEASESGADDDAALTAADASVVAAETPAVAARMTAAENADEAAPENSDAPAAGASVGGISADLGDAPTAEDVAMADATTRPDTGQAIDLAETPTGPSDSQAASANAATTGDATAAQADAPSEATATPAAIAASTSGAAAARDSGLATEPLSENAPPSLPAAEESGLSRSSGATDGIIREQGLAAASGTAVGPVDRQTPDRSAVEDPGAATSGAASDSPPESGQPRNLAIARAQTDALVSISTSSLPARRETARIAAPAPQRPESRSPESRPLVEPGQAAAAAPVSGAKIETPPEKERTVKLSDLDIQRYVAPRFPRGARYRDMTGYVDVRFKVMPNGTTGEITIIDAEPGDVFIDSAEEAISRWRFARRDDEVAAQVRLSFDLEE